MFLKITSKIKTLNILAHEHSKVGKKRVYQYLIKKLKYFQNLKKDIEYD